MNYKTKQIKGKGRGKLLGYPTINLEIPDGFNEKEGIYAGWVWIEKKRYKGAFHFGPVPTFHETEKSLEVFLIDAVEKDLGNLEKNIIEFELVKKIRDIVDFSTSQELSEKITQDVKDIETILS